MADTFCVLPFIHAHFYPTGDFRLCCMSGKDELVDESGRQLNLNTHTLREIWNSAALREVRRKLLAGERVEACAVCTREEASGQASHRVWAGEEWLVEHPEATEIEARVERAMTRDMRVEEPPIYFDLRPGNQCNLACRSCRPALSSKIADDPVQSGWWPELEPAQPRGSTGKPWYRDETVLLGELLEQVESTRKFYFAGGEPLLNPVVRRLVAMLIERGAASRVRLQFSTNATYWDERFFADLAAFEHVDLFLSIDGTEALFEYLRWPGRWDEVRANVERLRALPHLRLQVTPTVTNTSVLGLDALLSWADSLGLPHSLNLVYEPDFQSVRVLPPGARREARERLERWAEASPVCRSEPHHAERLGVLLRELDAELPADEYRLHLARMLEFTAQLDAARGQSLEAACPDLWRWLATEDRERSAA